MEVHATIQAFRQARRRLKGDLGLVPTMGYLHEGHLSLVRAAKSANDHVAATIFVNPTQFGPNEDLSSYPRDMDRDLALLQAEGVGLVFTPTPEEVYPPGFDSSIDPGRVAEPLEGAHRPGHFRGVATVVAKLFNIVQPTRAYFGQKDAQQVAVIKRMARDLDFPVEIVTVPTVREPDGLAMSSRNIYLTDDERRAALCLSRGLADAASAWSNGQRDAKALKAAVRDAVDREPLLQLEYVSLANAETMVELTGTVTGPALLSLAARASKARLIDNVVLGSIQSAT